MVNKSVYYQRFKSTEEKFWEKVDVRGNEECWEWLAGKNRQGYGMFKSGNYVTAPRFSWVFHNNCEIPNGLEVCHHCDNPSCVNPKHLFLGTRGDNMTDMWNKKRHPKPVIGNSSDDVLGEKNPCAKLREHDVLKIRRLFNSGVAQVELSALFNIKTQTIWKIVHRKTWVHI